MAKKYKRNESGTPPQGAPSTQGQSEPKPEQKPQPRDQQRSQQKTYQKPYANGRNQPHHAQYAPRQTPFKLFGISAVRAKRIGLALAAIILVGFIYSYIQTRNDLKRASDPQAATQQEATKLAGAVGKYLELPSGETPSVATVKNIDQLKDQAFFEHAKNGDKVLIYAEAGKAVLYRPSTKKVIEYAPVQLNK